MAPKINNYPISVSSLVNLEINKAQRIECKSYCKDLFNADWFD